MTSEKLVYCGEDIGARFKTGDLVTRVTGLGYESLVMDDNYNFAFIYTLYLRKLQDLTLLEKIVLFGREDI